MNNIYASVIDLCICYRFIVGVIIKMVRNVLENCELGIKLQYIDRRLIALYEINSLI